MTYYRPYFKPVYINPTSYSYRTYRGVQKLNPPEHLEKSMIQKYFEFVLLNRPDLVDEYVDKNITNFFKYSSLLLSYNLGESSEYIDTYNAVINSSNMIFDSNYEFGSTIQIHAALSDDLYYPLYMLVFPWRPLNSPASTPLLYIFYPILVLAPKSTPVNFEFSYPSYLFPTNDPGIAKLYMTTSTYVEGDSFRPSSNYSSIIKFTAQVENVQSYLNAPLITVPMTQTLSPSFSIIQVITPLAIPEICLSEDLLTFLSK
ncbi:hypothetical protein [Peromfec virus RodF7_22]|uniref:Uncharacterized protein n=1 Tax=Peromfec virus RodF7_22 TaxID=2929270 RepID=A0A976R7S6_9VIRU|nr:hypothetical protein [Peromfec virus RodF7_22]